MRRSVGLELQRRRIEMVQSLGGKALSQAITSRAAGSAGQPERLRARAIRVAMAIQTAQEDPSVAWRSLPLSTSVVPRVLFHSPGNTAPLAICEAVPSVAPATTRVPHIQARPGGDVRRHCADHGPWRLDSREPVDRKAQGLGEMNDGQCRSTTS